MTQTIAGLEFVRVPASHQPEHFSDVVAEGLSRPQKALPSRFFYDEIGSALFEMICDLPEYYLTRTEEAILRSNAEEIVATVGPEIGLVELGSGNSYKTRILIETALERQRALHYVPIDISSDFLYRSSIALLQDYAQISVRAIAATYEDAVSHLPQDHLPQLFLFLGSNIGNFDPPESVAFLHMIERNMRPCDRLLVGIDLIKDVALLEAAYNDSAGVTALFNKNLLGRIDRELGGQFNLETFEHVSRYNPKSARIESWLKSKVEQTVLIRDLNMTVRFHEGETIQTEHSHKYALSSFADLCASAGLTAVNRWTDEKNWFAVVLLRSEDAS